jgi:hypothetical protein
LQKQANEKYSLDIRYSFTFQLVYNVDILQWTTNSPTAINNKKAILITGQPTINLPEGVSS